LKVILASDHGGFALRAEIREHLEKSGVEVRDIGCDSPASCDYADYALPACTAVASGEADRAILVCGTGIGMSMAANKVKGIRAAVCSDCFSAKYTRLHNDANVLCLGARTTGPGLALMIVDLFLETGFEGGRHQTRIDKIAAIENRQ